VRLAWLGVAPIAVAFEALRVRLSVQPRRRYWQTRLAHGELLVVTLGDSLTQGIGASSPASSWVGRFAVHLQQQCGRSVRVGNRAAYGAKVADVLATQLPIPADAEVVTLCIGSNDAGRTSAEEFRRRLRQACAALPAGAIVGDVPEFQWGPRVSDAATLSVVVREVVAEFPGLVLARVEQATTGTRILTELAGDFFHPGDRGYARVASAFIPAASPAVDN